MFPSPRSNFPKEKRIFLRGKGQNGNTNHIHWRAISLEKKGVPLWRRKLNDIPNQVRIKFPQGEMDFPQGERTKLPWGEKELGMSQFFEKKVQGVNFCPNQMFFILLKSSQNINMESDLAFSIWTYELTIMVKRKTMKQIMINWFSQYIVNLIPSFSFP
jgi:hypothetical protein